MPRVKQSTGVCAFCGEEITKRSIAKHLAVCPRRQERMATAERRKVGQETLWHLEVRDAFLKQFWLHLEMRGSASLKDLDGYLRAIWLECCGHMSRFSVGGWGSDEIAKQRRADDVFQRGVELTHIYDFGTSSETLIKAIGSRVGRPLTAKPMVLMARNLQPEAACIECGKPAAWLCHECLIEDELWGVLCDEHADTHPHDNYGEPVQLYNSPRMGLCGYEGPAEPPY